ncbi:2-keto-4-pentenoate hydratase [Bhargavaea cecembensis]|uniref:2-keto-4-pentenoate hydratase n=1 Tax=Bhargavaea cecembensis TaxID=394098 RepID=A0A161STK8_9BACL|nr:fumarylacetoacetate hydrolase family protein [Bhargavaea cecembensis]KZE38990.1 2-keto-4-pentenoate hydratase [Bhargavaea cecembensis]
MSIHSKEIIQEAWLLLKRAEAEKQSVSPLTELHPGMTVEDAYRIQLKAINEKVEGGRTITGKKIGLTSFAMQELLGVDQPDYGHLLDSMEVEPNGEIPLEQLFQPKVEGEIAFVLKKDLKGPDVTVEDVLDATEYVVPSLEIVDSRIRDWKIKLPDTIADNASCGLYVLGKEKFPLDGLDLAKIEMTLYKNGELMNSGSGADVLGHPANCVAWLANKLSEYDVTLKAGEIVLSGALSAAVEVREGDRFTAEFTELGNVSVSFK